VPLAPHRTATFPGLAASRVEVDEAKVIAEAQKPQAYKWPGAKLKDGSVADY
jgi:hypothetical protein